MGTMKSRLTTRVRAHGNRIAFKTRFVLVLAQAGCVAALTMQVCAAAPMTVSGAPASGAIAVSHAATQPAGQATSQTAPATQATTQSPSASAQTTAANNTALVSQIAARLGHAKGVRARFTQTQTLAAMKQPLVSTGSLLFYRERGAVWQIDKPYPATWVISDSGVTARSADGQRIAGASAPGARGAAEVSKMMRAMLSGDLSALYSQFDVRAEGTTAHWQMQLSPAQPQIAQAIHSLTLTGGDFLQTLSITLASGDVTRFDFEDSAAISALSPAEQALFGTP